MPDRVSGPSYVWSCKKCGLANAPYTTACTACGCPTEIAPIELDPPKPPEAPKHFFEEPGTWLTFLPELPIAAILVLASPVWAMTLMLHGHIVAGILLLSGVAP